MRPSQTFCTMMKNRAVSACMPRKTGVMNASPMKPPIGSTSSLMMVAVSDDLTVRKASGVNRSTMANRSKRMRRSMRSPSTPLATLIQYLNAPLMMTKNRNSAGEAQQQPDAADLEALKIWIDAPPSHFGSPSVRGRNGASALPVAGKLCPGSPD